MLGGERTTCPCPRRRRESEVLVGCFVASVSEVSLAFCCVGREKQSQSGCSGKKTCELFSNKYVSGKLGCDYEDGDETCYYST